MAFNRISSLSLTRKFIAASVVVALIMLIALNVMVYRHFRAFSVSREQIVFEHNIAAVLKKHLRLFAFRREWNRDMEFNTLLNALQDYPDIIEIAFYSPDGELLYSMNHGSDLPADVERCRGLGAAMQGENHIFIDTMDALDCGSVGSRLSGDGTVQVYHYPFMFAGEVKGVVEIFRDFTGTLDAISGTRREATLLSLIGFIIYVVLLTLVVRRIEERERKLQQDLIMYQKLSCLGEFSAKMAHELGTPIHVMLGNIELLEDTTEDDFVKKRLSMVTRQIGKIQNIIRNYLYLSKKPYPEYSLLDVGETVDMVLDDLSYTTPDNVKLTRDVEDVQVVSDRSFIEQVLYNFIKNAADSIGEKDGTIHVEAKRQGEMLRLSVTDSGKGIPPDIRDKIFNPFFTTKKTGKGTGLGLSVCFDLVESLGGEVSCESEPGRTVFAFTVPVKAGA